MCRSARIPVSFSSRSTRLRGSKSKGEDLLQADEGILSNFDDSVARGMVDVVALACPLAEDAVAAILSGVSAVPYQKL